MRRVGSASRPAAREAGQAATELALALPFLVVLLLSLVQVGLVIRDQILLVHAAREAAREAAVSDGPSRAREAAVAGSGLDGHRLRVDIHGQRPGSTRVEARLRYAAPTKVVLVGPLLPDVHLRSFAAMRRER